MNLEVLATPCPVGIADVSEQMPGTWAQDIAEVVRDHAKGAVLSGGGPSSLEPRGASISYGLVDGRIVISELEWLDALYRGPWRSAASEFMDLELDVAIDSRSAVNLNSLKGPGSRYELHVDTNPCTGLLFATTHDASEGGDLVLSGSGTDLHIWPKAGTILIFDARNVPHRVNPLLTDVHRITVPMNYYLKNDTQNRSSLDDYLFADEV